MSLGRSFCANKKGGAGGGEWPHPRVAVWRGITSLTFQDSRQLFCCHTGRFNWLFVTSELEMIMDCMSKISLF